MGCRVHSVQFGFLNIPFLECFQIAFCSLGVFFSYFYYSCFFYAYFPKSQLQWRELSNRCLGWLGLSEILNCIALFQVLSKYFLFYKVLQFTSQMSSTKNKYIFLYIIKSCRSCTATSFCPQWMTAGDGSAWWNQQKQVPSCVLLLPSQLLQPFLSQAMSSLCANVQN